MGTPDFAAVPLKALIAQGHEIAAIYTRPPQKSGRGMAVKLSPVHQIGIDHKIPVETPNTLKDEAAAAQLASYKPDIVIVVAYGMLLPAAILDIPRYGCWNIHASLLPRWRGAAPIQRAIMAGDTETGVCIMQMDVGLDTGPVLARASYPIDLKDNVQSLHDALSHLGAEILLQTLTAFSKGEITRDDAIAQSEDGACYAPKIDKAEAAIDWTQSAEVIHNHIRGLSPFPGAWFSYQDMRIKLLDVEVDTARSAPPGTIIDSAGWIACGTGAILPVILQRAGKSPMPLADFRRGLKFEPGMVL